jgi:hypothetical protein
MVMVMVCSSEVATQLPGRGRSASRGKPVTPIRSAAATDDYRQKFLNRSGASSV